jgi:MFS superfamily sulfate permease-like transporter
LGWLFSYPMEWLRFDLLPGLTTAAVVIPMAMAYSMVVYALLGTSRPLSTSTTTTLAILSSAALGAAVPGADPASLAAAT